MRDVRHNGANGHSKRNVANGGQPGLNRDEGYAFLDRLTRKHFEMSASEFIEAWKSGQFQDENEYPEAVRLAMMIPLAV
jgi:hypothetical protein